MNILHKGRNVETRILLQESLPQSPVSSVGTAIRSRRWRICSHRRRPLRRNRARPVRSAPLSGRSGICRSTSPAGEPAEAGYFRTGPSGEISPEQQESEPIANGLVLDDDRFCVLLFGCPEGVGRQQHGSGKRILLREAAGPFPGSPARRLLFF